MSYRKINIRLELTTQDISGADEPQTESWEFRLNVADFHAATTGQLGVNPNILGILPYKMLHGGTGYELHRLGSILSFSHDDSDSLKLVKGQLAIRWHDSDDGREPFLLTYPFDPDDDNVEPDRIPNKPSASEWQLLLKQFPESTSPDKLQLIFVDSEGSGDRPPGPCDDLLAKVTNLVNSGQKNTNDYRQASFRYQACLNNAQ